MIDTDDKLVAALAGSHEQSILKSSATTEGAGTMFSLWKIAGMPPAGSNPPAFSGSGYQCTDATAGGIPYSNPASGKEARIGDASIGCSAASAIYIYDRLWACSGFSTTSITEQTVSNQTDIPARDADGAALGRGVEMFLEVYTAPGATGSTWTLKYTDDAGNAGVTTTYTHPANAETVGQLMPVALAAGDFGVRRFQSFQASISSGTAGDIGVTLARKVGAINISAANGMGEIDFWKGGGRRVYDDSCLFLVSLQSGTGSGLMVGQLRLAREQ